MAMQDSLVPVPGTRVRPHPPKEGAGGEMHVLPIFPKLVKVSFDVVASCYPVDFSSTTVSADCRVFVAFG
mgnify:CR=1 FL=1